LVDFNAVLRRARENAAETGGYHGNRGNRESDPQDIKGLADGGAVATETTAVDTRGNQIENGSHSNHRAEVATAEWIPKNARVGIHSSHGSHPKKHSTAIFGR